MSAKPHRLADYLTHMLEAIDRIGRYTEGMDSATFRGTPLVQDAVIRNLEILGEASRNVETRFPGFAEAHPSLPLGPAYQMRNALAHGYFAVDVELVWKTIRSDLPPLREQILAALNEPW